MKEKHFIPMLVLLFETILDNPENIKDIPHLYVYREIYTEKNPEREPNEEVKYRPICISETLLTVFHKCIID